MTLLLALAAAPIASADDGEVGDMGDIDSITDLFVDGQGRVKAIIDYPKDCPAGLTCVVDYMYEYQCPEPWCFGWGNQGWRTLPNPVNGVSTAKADCNGGQDIDNKWRLNYRVRWFAPVNQTVEFWGEYELLIELSGAANYRLIAEALFNLSTGAGFRGGTKIETTTAKQDNSPPAVVATSGGAVFHTC